MDSVIWHFTHIIHTGQDPAEVPWPPIYICMRQGTAGVPWPTVYETRHNWSPVYERRIFFITAVDPSLRLSPSLVHPYLDLSGFLVGGCMACAFVYLQPVILTEALLQMQDSNLVSPTYMKSLEKVMALL